MHGITIGKKLVYEHTCFLDKFPDPEFHRQVAVKGDN
jgi:hypothetical protein